MSQLVELVGVELVSSLREGKNESAETIAISDL